MAAGKLAALFSRRQARDLFDCHQILTPGTPNPERIRIAFVVYGAMNRKDWRTISLDDVGFDTEELTRQLLPTLHTSTKPDRQSLSEYGIRLVSECKRALSAVLPFTDTEYQFLDLILEEGKIEPEILTTDTTLQGFIRTHPLLEWKALNVRKHKMSR